MRIASIDLGTNTFRMMVADADRGGIKKLHVEREITRLSGGFRAEYGLISAEAAERSIRAVSRFSEIAKRCCVENLRAVATSVVREARNGVEFIQRIKRETAIDVEIITWEEEARLTVLGVLNSVPLNTDYALIFDIGGGSTEYMLLKGGNIIRMGSASLGVVRLCEKHIGGVGIPAEGDLDALSGEIEQVMSTELDSFDKEFGGELTLISTAGTPTTLASIDLGEEPYNPELVNGHVLSRNALRVMFDTLVNLDIRGRARMRGMEKGREDLLIPGCMILIKTMEMFYKDEVTVSDGGLLEGIAYSIM
ncbi:MAG: Ppx/GppA family phosphatase [Candidatus Dadabacteria bacterium]|nr:Ppx/GppA family phosphatase [Candidatus Dadabacteria bacterium]